MKKGIITFLFMMMFALLLSGCFKGEQSMEEIDTPPEEGAKAVDSDGNADEKSEEADEADENAAETVARQLYLVDAEGMVASQTLELPQEDSKAVAAQALEYLVKDGPVSSILPNGFQAVLPAGTEVLGLNLQEDGTMVVNVSEEFAEYQAKEELNILEAMTFTLTQFENVDKIQLQIDGKAIDEMPVDGTPIAEGYSRANGINLKESSATDLLESESVTMYYPAEHNENRYYVPVTQHIETEGEDSFSSIVQTMLNGPGYNTNATQVFNEQTKLTNKPSLNDGVLELKFNKEILKDADNAVISDEVMETLVRTLTEQEGVDAVDLQVEDVDQLVNENEEPYSEPVTKKSFIPTEKM